MYRDRWTKPAKRAFERLDAGQRQRILAAVDELCRDPLTASNVKALAGPLKGKYRKRVGDFRVIYSLDHQSRELYVLTIDQRGNVY